MTGYWIIIGINTAAIALAVSLYEFGAAFFLLGVISLATILVHYA